MNKRSVLCLVAAIILPSLLVLGCQTLPEPEKVTTYSWYKLPPGGVRVPIDAAHSIPVVSALVNGFGPYRMAIDTGATFSVISSRIAEEASIVVLPLVGSQATDGFGQSISIEGKARGLTVRIGTVRLPVDNAAVVPFEFPGTPVDALLGLDLLRSVAIEIDYQNQTVTFGANSAPSTDSEYTVPVRISSDRKGIAIPAKVGARSVNAKLDTGLHSTLVLPLEFLQDFEDLPTDKGRTGTLAGAVPTRSGSLRSNFSFGAHSHSKAWATIGSATTIGSGLLSRYRVLLDLPRRGISFYLPPRQSSPTNR